MSRKPLRILHALGAMNPGGVETWLLHVLRYSDQNRFQFDFCTFGPHPGLYADEVAELGGSVLRCPKNRNIWSFQRKFRQILRDRRYDIVHSHVHLFSGAILRWAKAEGVHVRIAHSHTSLDEKPATYARRAYSSLMRLWIRRYATHGLAASSAAALELFGENWQADGRFHVLHCGIDLRPFQEPMDRNEIRKELGIPPGAQVVGHVGRFVAPKNHRFLLEIVRETLKSRPSFHFAFVGDGPLRAEIEVRAKQMGLSDRIHFVGARTDVPRLMLAAMDAFVFPSLWEGLPVTLIEAQAAGLRCLVSSAVTKEVSIGYCDLVFMDTSAGPGEWAKRLISMADTGRLENGPAIAAIGNSVFSVQHSINDLERVYLEQGLDHARLSVRDPFAGARSGQE